MRINTKIKGKLLKIFGSKKSVDFDIKNAKNILFFRYDRIGDMVITTSVFRELKLVFPDIQITVLASKINQEVLINNPYVDHIVTNHKNHFFLDLLSLLILRKKKFDVCIEFDHSVVPHAILRLRVINPKKIISIKKDGRYGVSGKELSLYDIYAQKPKNGHFRDIWLGVLTPFNITPKSNEYDLFINDELINQAKNFTKQYSSNFLVGINLEGAVNGKKIKFPELFKICKGLNKQDKNIQIIILCAPNNFQETSLNVQKMALNYVEMSYKTNRVLTVAALISQLDLIITPDTSIVHIASAFNKPVVSIHEDNIDSYELFAPTSKLHRTVFSMSKKSLQGFSADLLIKHCIELINIIKKVDYE
ncbi:lipopolysaccharide heptosyltransferase family protein [Candidatus Thioglobus sp.]|nr:lipopolysaccharide heptosyltransferase family protein [Candidatus Thioglobus sp.]